MQLKPIGYDLFTFNSLELVEFNVSDRMASKNIIQPFIALVLPESRQEQYHFGIVTVCMEIQNSAWISKKYLCGLAVLSHPAPWKSGRSSGR